jgi:hypothetical protein
MIYQILADVVLVLHLLFIIFVVGGGLLVLKWRWVAFPHLPAAIWGAVIEFMGWYCPLTPLENHLRHIAGQSGYEGGFIEHYLLPVIYPHGLTSEVQIMLGIFVVAVNVVIYTFILLRKKKSRQ